jgi:hypothetical protein
MRAQSSSWEIGLKAERTALESGIRLNLLLTSTSIATSAYESGWAINPLSGSLYRFNPRYVASINNKTLISKVKTALENCNSPYNLRFSTTHPNEDYSHSSQARILKSVFKNMCKIGNERFFVSQIYASICKPIFESSVEAMCCFNSTVHVAPGNHCLQKCLTVAKLSKSFKKNGVIFIGAHLPLKEMHAWIIEGDTQPDFEDRSWINFTPLMAIHYK